MFRKLIATAVLALVAGCATAPKEDNPLTIVIGDDGKMKVVSAGGSPEDQVLAALMQSVLDGTLVEPEAEPLPEDQVWRTDGADNLTHIQSGAQCPQHWGEYTRTRTSIFKPDGMDVGCNYEARDGKVLTFYVYESDLSLADELASTMDTIKTRQPVSTEARFGSPPGSPAYVASALAYEDADGTKMRTSVALAKGGPWRLKMRLTCEADSAAQAENAAGLALMGQADRLQSGKPLPSAEKPSAI